MLLVDVLHQSVIIWVAWCKGARWQIYWNKCCGCWRASFTNNELPRKGKPGNVFCKRRGSKVIALVRQKLHSFLFILPWFIPRTIWWLKGGNESVFAPANPSIGKVRNPSLHNIRSGMTGWVFASKTCPGFLRACAPQRLVLNWAVVPYSKV